METIMGHIFRLSFKCVLFKISMKVSHQKGVTWKWLFKLIVKISLNKENVEFFYAAYVIPFRWDTFI